MVGIYCRVSTQEQAEKGYSIGEQKERMEKYCDAMEWKIYGVYIDAGYSGSNINRPYLQKLIQDVQDGRLTRVLVYKLDRLSRSQKDTLYLIEDVFIKNNVDFVSMRENFDTSTAFGRATIGILSVFSQLEREQIKERMEIGKIGRVKSGKYSGSRIAPIGYKYIAGELIIDKFEALQIRMIHDMYISGSSANAIADTLNSKGLVHRYGNWTASTVLNCIGKPLYIGKVSYNGNVYAGIHEKIIDEDIFDKAVELKKIRSDEHKINNKRRGKINSYLGGLLYCSKCGSKITKSTRVRGKYRYEKYICYSRIKTNMDLVKDPWCKNKIWDMQELDNIVLSEISKLTIEPQVKTDVHENTTMNVLIEERKSLDSRILSIMDLYSVGSIPIELLNKKISDLKEKKDKIDEQIHLISEQETNKLSQEEKEKAITSFKGILARGNFDEIRSVIELLINKIEIDDDDVIIYWNFD